MPNRIEPPHDKTNRMACAPSEDSDQPGHPPSLIRVFAVRSRIRPVWSESSLSAGRKLGSLATHWAHSEDSDQTGRMPRLIWVFAGRTVTLLVLSWGGSIFNSPNNHMHILPLTIAFKLEYALFCVNFMLKYLNLRQCSVWLLSKILMSKHLAENDFRTDIKMWKRRPDVIRNSCHTRHVVRKPAFA